MQNSPSFYLKQTFSLLESNWGKAIVGVLIFMGCLGPIQLFPILGSVVSFFIAGPLMVGAARFFLKIVRKEEVKYEIIFSGFENYGTNLIAYIIYIIVISIGMVLLIVPGIIAMLGLSQTFYILADNPHMSAVDALKKSWDMMVGYKLNYFVLLLLAMFLILAGTLLFLVGLLAAIPVVYTMMALFYDDLSGNVLENDDILNDLV